MDGIPSTGRFLLRVATYHVVTYFIVGVFAAIIVDYESLFEQPVVRDYMRAFGSISILVGPLVQVVRGVVIAAVLLPFRSALRARFGWLWLWLLLVGIGIVSTSAAAPSSIEGVVYTRLPFWYHAIGLPEVLVQTLIFSVLTALFIRHPQGVLAALPPIWGRLVRAAMVASLAFVGYAVVSVVFAIAAGARLDAEQNLTLSVQGVFIVPFLINVGTAMTAGSGLSQRRRAVAAASSYALSVISIFTYQWVVDGAANLPYALIAPAVPAVVVWLLLPRAKRQPLPAAARERSTPGGRSPLRMDESGGVSQ